MGHDVPDDAIERILSALGFSPRKTSPGVWQCSLPTWRLDATREIDLIEEVARHYGFEKFPSRLPPAKIAAARLRYALKEERIGETLRGLGYDEIISIPLEKKEDNARFSSAPPVRLANPLAEDASELRASGLLSMVRAIAWNLNRGQKDLRLYEIGKQYFGGGQQPVETWVLTLGATGQARAKNIEEVARPYGLADLKGAVEAVLSRFELGDVSWAPASEAPFFQPGRSAQVDAGPATRGVGGQRLGMLGQLAPQVAEALKLRQDVFLAQLNLQALYETPLRALRYQPLSRFPGVERDFSLILPEGTSFAGVVQAVRRLGINELVDVEAVDLFRGSQVPDGCFSLLLRLTFQSAEGTLTEEQINGYCERVVQALSAGLGAKIRR
jgi:phenylalanyl-tRNA synthetase beta chain